jgi:hypothetical protein
MSAANRVPGRNDTRVSADSDLDVDNALLYEAYFALQAEVRRKRPRSKLIIDLANVMRSAAHRLGTVSDEKIDTYSLIAAARAIQDGASVYCEICNEPVRRHGKIAKAHDDCGNKALKRQQRWDAPLNFADVNVVRMQRLLGKLPYGSFPEYPKICLRYQDDEWLHLLHWHLRKQPLHVFRDGSESYARSAWRDPLRAFIVALNGVHGRDCFAAAGDPRNCEDNARCMRVVDDVLIGADVAFALLSSRERPGQRTQYVRGKGSWTNALYRGAAVAAQGQCAEEGLGFIKYITPTEQEREKWKTREERQLEEADRPWKTWMDAHPDDRPDIFMADPAYREAYFCAEFTANGIERWGEVALVAGRPVPTYHMPTHYWERKKTAFENRHTYKRKQSANMLDDTRWPGDEPRHPKEPYRFPMCTHPMCGRLSRCNFSVTTTLIRDKGKRPASRDFF